MRCASQRLLSVRSSCTLPWLLPRQSKRSAPAGIEGQLQCPQATQGWAPLLSLSKECRTASPLYDLGFSRPGISAPESAREKPWTAPLVPRSACAINVNCARGMWASTHYTLKSESGHSSEESDSESTQAAGSSRVG